MLRINEIYRSVQGEGPRVGLPTTFVRFAGCNLRCPGWPCDTPHAIFPKEYRDQWTTISVDELVTKVLETTVPEENICLTGGEPWLQPAEQVLEFVKELIFCDRRVECFCNGTLPIPQSALANVHFVFDWKLPGSGELLSDTQEQTLLHNIHTAVDNATVKFTIADWNDFQLAVARETQMYEHPSRVWRKPIPIYVGPVWGKIEPSEIVTWLKDVDLIHWRLNLQTHKYIWKPDARRT